MLNIQKTKLQQLGMPKHDRLYGHGEEDGAGVYIEDWQLYDETAMDYQYIREKEAKAILFDHMMKWLREDDWDQFLCARMAWESEEDPFAEIIKIREPNINPNPSQTE